MLIVDVEPNPYRGINFLNIDSVTVQRIIDDIIELPLRNACKIFLKKGIQTVMSSANKCNVLEEGQQPLERKDVHEKIKELPDNIPTYEDAGKGYAWIMLDFNSLSDDNKDWLFSLEEKRGGNGERIGEKAIWFVTSFKSTDIKDSPKLKETTCHQSPYQLEKFNERKIVLGYDSRNVPNTDCNSKNANNS